MNYNSINDAKTTLIISICIPMTEVATLSEVVKLLFQRGSQELFMQREVNITATFPYTHGNCLLQYLLSIIAALISEGTRNRENRCR